MAEDKRGKARGEGAKQMPAWAAAALVVCAGTSLGLVAGYLLTRSTVREDAVAAAFAAIAKDKQFWDVVKESGYTARMRPELSSGSRAHIEMRCVREDVKCAPIPARKDAEIIVLKD